MYRQIELAIVPELPLKEVIADWATIRYLLTEGNRRRKKQIIKAFPDLTPETS